MTIFRAAALSAIVVLAPAAGPAAAQQEVPDAGPAAARQDVPDAGGRVYGLVGGAIGPGEFAAVGVGAGLRLTSRVGLDVELTYLDGDDDDHWPGWSGAFSVFNAMPSAEDYPPFHVDIDDLSFAPPRRSMTTFLTKFTVEFPVADGLLFPYLSGGGGVARTTEGYDAFPLPLIPWEDVPHDAHGAVDSDGSLRFSDFGVFPRPAAYSEIGLALVLGGGVDVRLWRGLAVGGDIRWLRVLRDYDALDLAQVTARLSYRF